VWLVGGQVVGRKGGFTKGELMETGGYDFENEYPFDSNIKRMAVVHKVRLPSASCRSQLGFGA
jgi:magnesium-transporting ATPase (P-type)